MWKLDIANHIYDSEPLLPKRSLPRSNIYTEELKMAFIDAFTLTLIIFWRPELLGSIEEIPGFISSIVLFFFLSIAGEFTFYFWHGILLHKTFLWHFHKEHHRIVHPTLESARNFDAIDWFFEFTLNVIGTGSLATYLITQ